MKTTNFACCLPKDLYAMLSIALLAMVLQLSAPTNASEKDKATAPSTVGSLNQSKEHVHYLASIRDRLLEAFAPAVHPGAKVTINFRIDPQGHASWVEIADASSSKAVNLAARDSIFYAQPYPKLPPDLKSLDLKAIFESDLSSSQIGGYSRPPVEQLKLASKLKREAADENSKGNLTGAIELLETALSATPFNYSIKRKYADYLLAASMEDSIQSCHFLHKAILALPRDKQAQNRLSAYWQKIGIDSSDYQKRYELAIDYDKKGKPEEALAEFYIAWDLNPDSQHIADINLASKHYLALREVKKWQKYYEQQPSPQSSQLLANAFKNAGLYKEAEELLNGKEPIDIELARVKELEKVSSTTLDASVPFEQEKRKMISVTQIANRQKSVDYLDHAIKKQKAVIRWTPGRFPLKVYVRDGRGVTGYNPSYRKMVIDSYSEWAKASGNRLSFVPVGSEKGANIVVTWTANPADLAMLSGLSGKEQGVTFFKYKKAQKGNYTIIGADVKILTIRRDRKNKILSPNLMRSVIRHELGHSLGIAGHSPYMTDLMFPALMPKNHSISPQDRATIIRLYQGYEH